MADAAGQSLTAEAAAHITPETGNKARSELVSKLMAAEVTAPVAEPVVEPPKPVDGTKKDLASPQLAAVMRREAEANRAAMAAKKAIKDAEAARKAMEDFEKDPFAFMESKRPGAYKEWTQLLIEGKSPVPEDPKVAGIKTELDSLKEQVRIANEEKAAAREEAAKTQGLKEISELLKSDDFELTRNYKGADEEILKLCLGHFKQTLNPDTGKGEILSWQDAASMLESELDSRTSALLATKKGRSMAEKLLGPTRTAPATAVARPSETITNQMASSAPAVVPGHRETREEAKRRIYLEAIKEGQ